MKNDNKNIAAYNIDDEFESYSLRDARANLSQLVTNVEQKKKFYGIKKRGKLVGVLVDFDLAKELLLSRRLQQEERKKSFERAMEKLAKLHASYPKPKKLVNISGNIDKILYGI